MSTCEATFSSDDSPSIHNSNTHSKSKCSIRSWVAHVKAKCRISKPKLLENNHNTASNNSDNDDHHDGALALSDLIRQDFHFMKEEIAKIKNYVDHVDGQINQAYQNFEELHTRGSREGELHEVKKAVAKLKSRIPSQLRIPSADSNPHRNSWPDINKSSDEMMQLYMVPKSKSTIDSAHLWKAFSDLTALSRYLLLCFFLFPPKAIIKRRDIIYLCISEYFQLGENRVNEVLDRLIGMDFIEPVYQKCSLVPDSCRMPLSVRSALSNKAMTYASTSKYNTDLKLLKTMSISDGKSAPSSSSDDTGNPYVNNSSPDEAKFSVRSSGAQYFKSNCRISESESESESESMHKSLEDHHHNSPSSSITTTSKIDDHRLYNLIREDLFIMKKTLAEAKKNVDNMDVQINQANGKFEDLQARGSSERELAEFKVAIVKLKSHIPSQLKIHVNSHRNSWPDINKYSDEMMHLYTEPKFVDTIDSYGLFEAFHGLTEPLQGCLLCFLLFPPEAVIKRKVMIYSWISNERFMNEDIANAILDKFIERGIIEPVCQKCTLVPDSCRMSLSVRSALSIRAMLFGITSKYNTGGITEVHGRYESYLINASESTVGGKLFEKKCIKTLYLGRWQSSATHHIEVADNKVLHGLKNMKQLTFLSLRGISMITELPTFISELTSLKILDLKACHNLEGVPDGIGLLENLTHLDMSECYFIENMPRSLANLSRLKVLKGFFIGDSKNNKRSCTLENLSRLRYLRKLNIYTGVKDFPEEGQLSALQKFAALQNLTISWGGYSSPDGSNAIPETRKLSNKPDLSLPSRLQKLDLQCFHGTSPPSWLRLSNMKELKKLYIKGGQLCNLHKSLKPNASNQCTVEILCLKYLGKLKMDWEDLMILFPKLIFLHKVECPKLSNIPCNKSGVWKDKKVVDQAQPAQAKLQQ